MLPGLRATIGELRARGVAVRWICQECQATGLADLDRIIAAKGPDYCLTDRTAACRAAGCTYWVGFYAQAGMRNWKLRTDDGMRIEMARRSEWLSAKWRREGLLAPMSSRKP